jgi:chitin synthase
MIYCYIVTFFLPGVFLKKLGYSTLDRRRAFREKLGLLSVIAALMASVGFLTFGFTDAVCDNTGSRFRTGTVQGGSMIFHGYDYAMDTFQHPAANGIATNSNPLYSDWAAGGKDGSFMFQKVNQNCKGIITRGTRSQIPYDARTGDLGWYFPCNIYDQYGSTPVNSTGYGAGQLCHTRNSARNLFDEGRYRNVSGGFVWQGPVYYTWDDIKNSSRNLGVYKGWVQFSDFAFRTN